MRAGVNAGILIFVTFAVCSELLPQPLGLTLYWVLGAAALATAAVLTWRRTRLPIATAGMSCVAVASVMLVGLNLAGYPWPSTAAGPFNLPLPWEVAVLALLLAAPISVVIEARVHRTAWLQWSKHMEQQGLWDLLRFRHIPVLRDRHGSSA